jgi:stress-induced morphogen
LSGNTAKAIQNVDPQFIKIARIDQSLTPGRNNGFLNMLQSMKNKALSLDEAARRREKEEGTAGSESTSSSSSTTEDEESSSTSTDVNNNNNSSETNGSSSDDDDDDDDDEEGGPKYKAIVQSLQALKPTSLQLDDNSDQYDNNDSDDSESHFGLYIVAPAFDGLNVIKRQQLIYMILGDLMPQIEALQITSLTPDEEAEQQSA